MCGISGTVGRAVEEELSAMTDCNRTQNRALRLLNRNNIPGEI